MKSFIKLTLISILLIFLTSNFYQNNTYFNTNETYTNTEKILNPKQFSKQKLVLHSYHLNHVDPASFPPLSNDMNIGIYDDPPLPKPGSPPPPSGKNKDVIVDEPPLPKPGSPPPPSH